MSGPTTASSGVALADPPISALWGLDRRLRGQRASLEGRVEASHRDIQALRREVAALTALVVDQHRMMAELTDTMRLRVDRVQRVIDGQAKQPAPPDRVPQADAGPRELNGKRGLGRGLDALFTRPSEGEA